MKKHILILLLFVLLTAAFTFPLVFNLKSCIPGFHSTDEPYAALWNFWWLKHVWINHLPESSCSLIAAPFGIDFFKSGYPLWNAINKWLSILTNNIFAYNAETLFSFIAAGFFMYYLTNKLTKNTLCSVFSAIIYDFCPYQFARAWQHLGLAQIQWMPFYILSLLRLKDNPDFKHALLVALSFFLVFSFDLYYAYFMVIVSVIFFIFIFGYNWKTRLKEKYPWQGEFRALGMAILAGIMVFFLTLPSTSLIFKGRPDSKEYKRPASAFNPFRRPFEDLFEQSARPLSYFLPATAHPVFGKFTEQFIGSSLHGTSFTEHALYLGWIPIILAFIAFRRRKKDIKLRVAEGEHFYIVFFLFLAIVAWFFSQPPWWNIALIKVYMPSFFLYKIAPMFRAYCRFGIIVMLALSVLAGFGLKFILEKLKTKKAKGAIGVLFCGLILFEFWNFPPFKVIDLSGVPAVYYWLKAEPADAVIAEYPIDADSPNEMYKFFQTIHEKRIINGTIPETYANRIAKGIVKLSKPDTAGILKWLGVKYVLVHIDDYLKTDLLLDMEELNKIPDNANLKIVKSFPAQGCPKEGVMCSGNSGPIDVYEITASALKPGAE